MPDMTLQDIIARLVYEDMSSRPDLSPWLASVYVIPEYRNRGIGSQLVRTIEEISQKLCVSRLYLFTPDRIKFYVRLGWVVTEKTNYRNQRVVIMSKSF